MESFDPDKAKNKQIDDTAGPRELDHRGESDGLSVSLIWLGEDRFIIAVEDLRSGDNFVVPAGADDAIEVFNHPYAYRDEIRLAVEDFIKSVQSDIAALAEAE